MEPCAQADRADFEWRRCAPDTVDTIDCIVWVETITRISRIGATWTIGATYPLGGTYAIGATCTVGAINTIGRTFIIGAIYTINAVYASDTINRIGAIYARFTETPQRFLEPPGRLVGIHQGKRRECHYEHPTSYCCTPTRAGQL